MIVHHFAAYYGPGDHVIDVSGYIPSESNVAEHKYYGIGNIKWAVWLGMPIDEVSFTHFSMLDLAVYALWDMTFYGFSEEEISAAFKISEDMLNDYLSKQV